MKLFKRLFIVSLSVILLAANLSGCSKSSKNSDEAELPDGQQTEDVENSDEKVTLRFSWWGGDSRHEATLACIDAFMKENPNIVIEAEYGGFDGYQQKISASLAGGTEPDIMQLDAPWMNIFLTQNENFFVDISKYEDSIDLSGFSEDFLNNFCKYNEKLVSLPSGINALNFLANKAVLDEAGVSFGDTITWEDLITEGKKVNALNPENYMINLDNGIFYFLTRIYLYQLSDANLINDDYTIGVSKEDFAKAFAFTKKMYDEKVIIPYEEATIFTGAPQDNPKWNNNQMGGWLNWASNADQQNWGENAVSLPYPQIEGAKNSGVLVRPSQVFAVSSNSEHPEEALKFLDYMFNSETGIMTLHTSRSIPPTENARVLLEEQGLVNPAVAQGIEYAMENQGTPETALSSNSEVGAAISGVLEKLIYDQYDAEAAAEEVYVLLEDVLDMLKSNAE
ncbi:MAG: extracellular solute-binding protein [Anaerocolumna sp.]